MNLSIDTIKDRMKRILCKVGASPRTKSFSSPACDCGEP